MMKVVQQLEARSQLYLALRSGLLICGVGLRGFDRASLAQGLDQLLALAVDPSTPARCVAAAQKHFSLDEGVQRYAAVYQKLGVGA